MSNENEFADFEVEQDFNDIKPMEGGNYPLVPVGDYTFDIENVIQKPSSNNNPMVVVTFVVAEGEFQGAKVWGNYPLVKQSLGRLKQLMVACNANLDKFRAAEIMGARIRGTIVHSEGQVQVGPDGNPLPVRTFANISNEQPLEVVETKPETKAANKVASPPVTNKGKPAGNSAPAGRRA